jgi:hypothetical protein
MATIDVGQLMQDMATTMTTILKTDVTLLRGYSQAKAKSIARVSKLVAEGYASGEIDQSEFEMELDEVDFMIERFVRNLGALANTTIERVINALTGAIYGAIKLVAAGAGVPLPALNLPRE